MMRKRIRQVIWYGWKDAKEIASYSDVKKIRLFVFFDILLFFRKYYVFSNQYKTNGFWKLSTAECADIAEEVGKKNRMIDDWYDDYFANRGFLQKYTSRKYETSPNMILKRNKAYTNRYHIGDNCYIQFNVELSREHLLFGTIDIGKNVIISKNVFIDYSGNVIIGDDVRLSDGVVIESHEHLGFTNLCVDMYKVNPKRVILEKGVVIGSKAIIHASVGCIGRYARVGAGAVLRHSVPPYAIVMGNPAKIVGFSMTPSQVLEFELEKYPEGERISIEKYTKDYNKLFLDRVDEIKQFIKKSC